MLILEPYSFPFCGGVVRVYKIIIILNTVHSTAEYLIKWDDFYKQLRGISRLRIPWRSKEGQNTDEWMDDPFQWGMFPNKLSGQQCHCLILETTMMMVIYLSSTFFALCLSSFQFITWKSDDVNKSAEQFLIYHKFGHVSTTPVVVVDGGWSVRSIAPWCGVFCMRGRGTLLLCCHCFWFPLNPDIHNHIFRLSPLLSPIIIRGLVCRLLMAWPSANELTISHLMRP